MSGLSMRHPISTSFFALLSASSFPATLSWPFTHINTLGLSCICLFRTSSTHDRGSSYSHTTGSISFARLPNCLGLPDPRLPMLASLPAPPRPPRLPSYPGTAPSPHGPRGPLLAPAASCLLLNFLRRKVSHFHCPTISTASLHPPQPNPLVPHHHANAVYSRTSILA